jgi:hypothetical protein
MVAVKTHKKLQHVSIHFQIILRELVSSLLKSLIKTVRSQILVMRQHIVSCVCVCVSLNIGKYVDCSTYECL